ncbi:hypothetical protein JL720_2811 [Aureococcus anophagefferens]|nr:hypothetical protein JL720_2811 [Aureococcus anophagefferens]
MVKDVNRAELDALEVFVRARQQRLTRCVESDLALQYQVLQCGDRLGERMVARARKKMLLQDEGKTLDDAPLLDPVDPYLEAFDSSMTVVPSYDVSAARIPGVVADSGASFRWNLTYSTATNRVVRKNAPQLIPGLIGTPAAAEHKTAPGAKVAGGFDFSLQEFLNCVRTGKGGLGMLEPALPNASKLANLSDAALTKIFYMIDEDRSNSLSFDEFYTALESWEDERRAARDRERRLRESHSLLELSTLFDEIDDDGNGDLTAQEFLEGLEALDALKNGGKQSPRKKLSHEASLQSLASAGTVVTADDKRRPATEGGGRNQRGRVRSCICR